MSNFKKGDSVKAIIEDKLVPATYIGSIGSRSRVQYKVKDVRSENRGDDTVTETTIDTADVKGA